MESVLLGFTFEGSGKYLESRQSHTVTTTEDAPFIY